MKRYFSLYRMLVKLNLHILLLDRDTLINNIISSILWGMFPFVSIFLLTSRSKSFYHWSKDELYLLTGCFIFFIGIFLTLFGRSFKRFAVLSDFGYLDETLLRPVDAQFLISFWNINFVNIFRIVFGILLIIVMQGKLHMHTNLFTYVLFALTTTGGLLLLYSIWFLCLTLTVWFPKLSNLRELLVTLNTVTRYPPEAFQQLFYLFFLFFLPFSLVVSVPAKTLLQEASVLTIGMLWAIAVGIFLCSRVFWRIALRHYTSAGG